MARPSDFTPELAERICELLPFADRGVAEVCEADDMPHESTVFRWLIREGEQYDAFRVLYARARRLGGEVQGRRAMGEALTATDPQLGRLRYDARRWTAGRLDGKWSDKVQVVGGDPDEGDRPISHAVEATVTFKRPGE